MGTIYTSKQVSAPAPGNPTHSMFVDSGIKPYPLLVHPPVKNKKEKKKSHSNQIQQVKSLQMTFNETDS
jgi:hypothetical protein